MVLENINLSEVAHTFSLADVTGTKSVIISNVTGNIAPIISRIKCLKLDIQGMRLSTEDTAALVQGMQTSVEEVHLGQYDSKVMLDIDTLITYNGRGKCKRVWFWNETMRSYVDQLVTWEENMGWRDVWRDGASRVSLDFCYKMERKYN